MHTTVLKKVVNQKNCAIVAAAVFLLCGSFWYFFQPTTAREERDITAPAHHVHVSTDEYACTAGECITREIPAPLPFEFAAVSTAHTNPFLIRFFDGDTWTAWFPFHGEADQRDGEATIREQQLFVMHAASAFQIKMARFSDGAVDLELFTVPKFSDRQNSSKVHMAVEGVGSTVSSTLSLTPPPVLPVPPVSQPPQSTATSSPAQFSENQSATSSPQSQPPTPSPPPVTVRALSESYAEPIIIPRSQWLDAGIEIPDATREQLWPSQYDDIKKIVVHHTASVVRDVNGDGVLDTRDYREAVRGIYYYHSKVNKWGDVGYQYIIDPQGTVWEGRAGDGIVGGHTFRDKYCTKFGAANIAFNRGTIGIAMLGTFNSEMITIPAEEALTSLIAKKAWEFQFSPGASGFFMDKVYPNIVGHRDLDCTQCPGDQVYNSLGEITSIAQKKYEQYTSVHPRTTQALPDERNPLTVEMKKGDTYLLHLQFRNTGTVVWRNYGQTPMMIASSEIMSRLASLESLHLAAVGGEKNESAPSADIMTAVLTSPNVAPGAIGSFDLSLSDIPDELITKKDFVLALGNLGYLATSKTTVQLVNTGLEWAATLDEPRDTIVIPDDRQSQTTLTFENRGVVAWKRGDVVLSLSDENGKLSTFATKAWKNKSGAFQFQEKSVEPGEYATFAVPLAKNSAGTYTIKPLLEHEGERVSGSDYAGITIEVQPAYRAEIRDYFVPDTVTAGSLTSASMLLENTGYFPLKKVALQSLDKKGAAPSIFRATSWKGATLATIPDVQSGEALLILFDMAAPRVKGSYVQHFVLKQGTTRIPLEAEDGTGIFFERTTRVEPEVITVPKKKVAAVKQTVKKPAAKTVKKR